MKVLLVRTLEAESAGAVPVPPAGRDGGIRVCESHDALRAARLQLPDLVIIEDGGSSRPCALCLRMRSVLPCPVLILPASHSEAVASALAASNGNGGSGNDAPASMEQVVGSLARSDRGDDSLLYEDDRVLLDARRRRATVSGSLVHLTSTEWRLLRCLMSRSGEIVPRRQILADVWGWAPEYAPEPGCLYLYVSYLRQKIEEDPANPRLILTEWGTGYRFLPAA